MQPIKDIVNNLLHTLNMAKELSYLGEPISQLEHALQCAYFADQAGQSDEVIIASLFHDVGHFTSEVTKINMAQYGVAQHEWIGARLTLELGFSHKVALLIGYHVEAKRYLARKDQRYYEQLSDASKMTLKHQGGPMCDDEMSHFVEHMYFNEIIQVRMNDDKGKIIGLAVPGLDFYRDKITSHLLKQRQGMVL